jgi:hypothetical protein
VSHIADIAEVPRKKLAWQQKLAIFARIKTRMGETSLMWLAFGLAFGYPTYVLSSYFQAPFFWFQVILPAEFSYSAVYHRLYLMVACGLLAVVLSLFRWSPGFRELLVNRYTMKHAFSMFKEFFTRQSDGVVPVEEAVHAALETGKQKWNAIAEHLKTEHEERKKKFAGFGQALAEGWKNRPKPEHGKASTPRPEPPEEDEAVDDPEVTDAGAEEGEWF